MIGYSKTDRVAYKHKMNFMLCIVCTRFRKPCASTNVYCAEFVLMRFFVHHYRLARIQLIQHISNLLKSCRVKIIHHSFRAHIVHLTIVADNLN